MYLCALSNSLIQTMIAFNESCFFWFLYEIIIIIFNFLGNYGYKISPPVTKKKHVVLFFQRDPPPSPTYMGTSYQLKVHDAMHLYIFEQPILLISIFIHISTKTITYAYRHMFNVKV